MTLHGPLSESFLLRLAQFTILLMEGDFQGPKEIAGVTLKWLWP